MRKELVEVGIALITIGIFFLVVSYIDIFAYIHPPLLVISLGSIIIILSLAMRFVGSRLTLILHFVSVAIHVFAWLTIVFLALSLVWIHPLYPAKKYLVYSLEENVGELKISIDVGKVDVNIHSWDSDKYLVRVYIRDNITGYCKPLLHRQDYNGILNVEIRDPKYCSPRIGATIIEVAIPEEKKLDLNLRAGAGSIIIKEVSAESLLIHLSTGRVQVENVSASSASIEVNVGSVYSGIDASSAEIRVNTGSIDLDILGRKNGSINVSTNIGNVNIRLGGKAGYNVYASLNIGSIDTYGEFIVIEENSNKFVAYTPDIYKEGAKVTISVKVNIGGIDIKRD